jgi:hypothetical protein
MGEGVRAGGGGREGKMAVRDGYLIHSPTGGKNHLLPSINNNAITFELCVVGSKRAGNGRDTLIISIHLFPRQASRGGRTRWR